MPSVIFLSIIIAILLLLVLQNAFKKLNINHSVMRQFDELEQIHNDYEHQLNMVCETNIYLINRVQSIDIQLRSLVDLYPLLIPKINTIQLIVHNALYSLQKQYVAKNI